MALSTRPMAPSTRISTSLRSLRSGRTRCVVVHASQPLTWAAQWKYLNSKGLASLSPEAAMKMVQDGKAVLVDVRPRNLYEKGHCEGAVSVPLYQNIDFSSGQVVTKALKWAAYAFNGVSPIELNPNFIKEINQVSQNGQKGVITICEAGGTMKPTINFPQGKASRSLQSAFRIINETDATNVMHLDRGLYGWYQADLPFEGEYEPDVGRTPMAAEEPTLKLMASAKGYEIRPNDK